MARRKEKNERNAFFVVRGSGRKRRRVATAHRVCTKRLLSSFRAYRETKSSDLCQSVGDSRAPRIPRSRVHPLKSSSLPIFLSFFLFFFFLFFFTTAPHFRVRVRGCSHHVCSKRARTIRFLESSRLFSISVHRRYLVRGRGYG